MAGRKPKPTALKVLTGNPGKRKLPPKSAVAALLASAMTEVPSPPEWFDEYARQKWADVAPWLVSSKILTATDLHSLEAFCSAYSRWRQGEADVVKNGIVIPAGEAGWAKNPAVTVINEALRQMTAHGSVLGLDPVSRTRVGGPPKDTTDELNDDAFMRARER